jgi:hypothetical protein
MTPYENVMALYEALAKLGHFPLLTITVEDLMEREVASSEDEARTLCQELAKRWQDGDDYEMALDWAEEIREELSEKNK